MSSHLPIYETTHFFERESDDQNFKKRALLQCQCIEHESTVYLRTVFNVSILETGLSFYVVIVRATQRTSHLQSKGKTFISQYLLEPVSIQARPRGVETSTLSLCCQTLYQLS